jgi:hypothetical protein
MDDQRIDARFLHDAREFVEVLLPIVLGDADAAFDGDRNLHARLHGRDTIGDEARLRHETSAKTALLHAIRGTADVEINLVVAEIGCDLRAVRKLPGRAAAELKRNRMLRRIVGKKPRAVAVDDRRCRDHFRIDARTAREQAMEEPAMPIGPFHHRSDAEQVRVIVHVRIQQFLTHN